MSDKTDIYAFHRLSGRKAHRKFVLPEFPKQAIYKFLKEVVSWDAILLITIAFFSGRAFFSGGLMPFPVAVLAAVMAIMPEKGLWVLAATTGGMYTVTSGYSLGATITCLILLAMVLGRTRGQFRQKWYGVPLLVAGVTITVKVGVFAYFEPTLYNYLLAIFEAVIAGCASFLLIRALPALRKKGSLASLKKEEIIGGAVFIIAVLTGLSGIAIEGIEIKNIIGRTLVLFAAYSGGSGFGAAMGTLVGMIPGINTIVAPGLVAVYSFSGMLAGMFRSFGRLGVCIGFILGNVFLSIYLTEYSKLIITFSETALAVLMFLAVPPKRLFAIRSLVKNSITSYGARSVSDNRIRENTAGKIREYARIFRELSSSVEEVSCDYKVYEENNLQNLFNGISAKVCKGCSLHRVCWEKDFYKTYKSIMDMLAQIEFNGRMTEENIPADIQKRCTRLRELAITINCLFESYKQTQIWQRKLAEGRDIVGGQLAGISSIMQNLADEIRIDIRMREDIETILRSELTRAGYQILDLTVAGNGSQQMEINISCPSCGGKMACTNGIGPAVSKILFQPLTVLNSNYCTQKTGDPVCEFKLTPVRAYDVEMGIASLPKEGQPVSGDSYTTFDLKDGKYAMVLSDGMGVGQKASTESKAAITLLEKLMESGFEKNTAVKTVNSILVLGSQDETFATIDLAIVDLMKGKADFIKIGSAPSFVKRGSQVSMIRANSLPIGIINNIEVDAIQYPIGHDDVIVLVSDGLIESPDHEVPGESWVMDTLQNIITTDPQNIADLLLNRAILNGGGSVSDDVTVLVARIAAVGQARHR